MTNNYSEKELELFERLGYDHLVNVYNFPPLIYRDIAYYLFMENRSGPLVESVRRCNKAIDNNSVIINTKEWDDLISFE